MDAHVPQCAGVVRLSPVDFTRRWPAAWLAIAWMLLLAVCPWWLGLPLLLSMAVALLIDVRRLHEHAGIMRRGLRWGLPGLLLAVLRALGIGPLGVTLTLLSALVGFSLLVLLESWLDRKPKNASSPSPAPSLEWNEMALAPIGPAAEIIELKPPEWLPLDGPVIDGCLGIHHYANHSCLVANHHGIDGIDPFACTTSLEGWLALKLAAGRGVVLYHRTSGKQHRLRGWTLYGWNGPQPWLSRGEENAPLALAHVLGHDQRDE